MVLKVNIILVQFYFNELICAIVNISPATVMFTVFNNEKRLMDILKFENLSFDL